MMTAEIVADGFTRDRDLVAYLFYKHSRVTQYELRHIYGIKNPAQAINDAEEQFNFQTTTGDQLPNGDIPYSLRHGTIPQIAGTIPIWAQSVLEDTEDKIYVVELDFYECVVCWRHPVYRPKVEGDEMWGVCPRHGWYMFRRIEH
jgi:hypothetical protein